MPIPEIKEGEDRNTYVSRCINVLKKSDKGKDPKQIAAICYSKWQDHSDDDDVTPFYIDDEDGYLVFETKDLIECEACNFNDINMTKLTYKRRKELPESAFCGPDRSYPANDAAHVRNGLARLAQNRGRYPSSTVQKILSCLRSRAKKYGVTVSSSEEEDLLNITWTLTWDGEKVKLWELKEDFALVREDDEYLLQFRKDGEIDLLLLHDSLCTVDYLPHITDEEWKAAKTTLMEAARELLEENENGN